MRDRPLCIYGADFPPENSMPMASVNRCLARAIFGVSTKKNEPPIYISEESKEKCCPGGQSYFGVSPRNPMIKHFVSVGTKDFMGGAAEYLKPSPEAAERFFGATGEIKPLGKFILVSATEDIETDPGVKAILVFGNAERIRNLGGLIQFGSDDLFTSILMPGGASCASFVTYASGMAERAPRNAAFIGPVDPTGNNWFPEDYLSLSVPIHIARRMARDVDDSFLAKRPQIAFPSKRVSKG